MRRILYYIIGIAVVLYGWHEHLRRQGAILDETASGPDPAGLAVERERGVERQPVVERFQCDGRVYCSQMRSCAEATWALQHCPGTKMDGDGDGVPCEDQFCGHE